MTYLTEKLIIHVLFGTFHTKDLGCQVNKLKMKTAGVNIKEITELFIENVFRTSIDKPGFAFVDLGDKIDSYRLRSIMVELKKGLSNFTKARFNKQLTYEWLGRFDQQVSTKYHLDNASDESFLMLGYEPSEIDSELYLADYVKFSYDNKIDPVNYFEKYNPIFKGNETVLKPYVTKVESFRKDTYKIVLINNSKAKLNFNTLGVLHMARIIKPDLSKSRVINSMMLRLVIEADVKENEENEEAFKSTDLVSR